MNPQGLNTRPPYIQVLVDVEMVAAGPVLCEPATLSGPGPGELTLREREEELFMKCENSRESSRVPVRAARSSSGSLLFRRRSAVLCIRRSRAVVEREVGTSPRAAPRLLL